MTTKKQIGVVRATVEFPVYEGDYLEQKFDWFEYREPVIQDGEILPIVRKCKLVGKAELISNV